MGHLIHKDHFIRVKGHRKICKLQGKKTFISRCEKGWSRPIRVIYLKTASEKIIFSGSDTMPRLNYLKMDFKKKGGEYIHPPYLHIMSFSILVDHLIESDNSRSGNERNYRHQLYQDVHGRTGGILEGIADGIADNTSLVSL